ncbi:MAG: hypothetical protein V3S61_05040 [Dehalococcoidales bacterium]
MAQGESGQTARKWASYFGMFLSASVTGFIFGLIGAFIGAAMFRGELFGFGDLAGALAGIIIGYPIGVIAGIFLVSRVARYRGSVALGFTGSILGGVLTMGLAEPLNLNINANLLFALFFIAPPLLGTIGFHLKLKWLRED